MGAIGAVLGVIVLIVIAVVKKVVARFALQPDSNRGGRAALKAVAVPAGGGLIFGLLGVAMPLTFGSGSSQLGQMIAQHSHLHARLILASMFTKMFTLGLCVSTGFVGGFVFPLLFIGGAAGTVISKWLTWVPWGLSFSCMFAAVPGSFLPMPLTLIFLAGFSISINAVQLAPVALALLTSFCLQAGLGMVLTIATRARTKTSPPTS